MNYIFKNNIKIKISGRNINGYLKRILLYKINIIKLIPHSYKEIYLIISYKDYLKLKDYRSIYTIEIISTYGIIYIKETIKKYLIIIICLFLGLSLNIFLSNIIFEVEVIHSNYDIINLLESELANYNIKKYTFRKSYSKIEQIIKNILNNNKDKFEWIEIIKSGTKYIVRVEERKINKKDLTSNYQNIISTKSSVITEIIAYSGEKVKNINDYVKKGDVIISGVITLPDGTTSLTKAIGKVYGEVWYTVTVEYPFVYKEETLTGKVKNVYVLNFINKRISLFDFKKYNTFKYNTKVIFNDSLNIISFEKEKQYEMKLIDVIYSVEEINAIAYNLARDKLLSQNKKIRSIKKITVIDKENLNTKMKYKFFISLIEEIGEIQKIEENTNLE